MDEIALKSDSLKSKSHWILFFVLFPISVSHDSKSSLACVLFIGPTQYDSCLIILALINQLGVNNVPSSRPQFCIQLCILN